MSDENNYVTLADRIKKHEVMLLDRFLYCPSCGSHRFAVNDERSKRCEDCGFTYYINASGAYVAVIMNERDELLVVRRKREPAKGTLDLPGGFADPGETAEEGVAREVLEETGLRIEKAEYLFSIPNRYVFSGMMIPTLDLFFRCRVGDVSALRAQDDAEDAQWIPLRELCPEEFGLQSIRLGVRRIINVSQDPVEG